MTWFISDLHIQGVKGVLDRSGDFKLANKRMPRSLAIFAPNGCGKSGYADAIEYFFSENGGVEHLGKGGFDSERGGKHALTHILAEELGIKPEVSVTFANTDTDGKITISRPVNLGRSDNRPEDLSRILSSAPAHRVLRQHDLRRFVVDMAPGEKYSELSRWIGLTRLEMILKHLETASNELAKVDLDREVTERQNDVLTNTNWEVTTFAEDDIYVWCQNKASVLLSHKTLVASRDELSVIVNELSELKEKRILESSVSIAYQAKNYLEKELPQVLKTGGLIDECIVALGKTIQADNAAKELIKTVQTSIYKQTWEVAQELLLRGPIKKCPICKTEWENTALGSQNEARIHIKANLGELSSLTKAETRHKEEAVALQIRIKPICDKLVVIRSLYWLLFLSTGHYCVTGVDSTMV